MVSDSTIPGVPLLTREEFRKQRTREKTFKTGGQTEAEKMKREALRLACLCGVTVTDIMEIMQALVEKAKKGDSRSAKEVFDRCIGKADESELVRKLEQLEAIVLGDEDAE